MAYIIASGDVSHFDLAKAENLVYAGVTKVDDALSNSMGVMTNSSEPPQVARAIGAHGLDLSSPTSHSDIN